MPPIISTPTHYHHLPWGIHFCNNTASPTMKHRIQKHMVNKFHTLLLFSILLLTTKFPERVFLRIVFWSMMLWHQVTVPQFLRQCKGLICKDQNVQEFILNFNPGEFSQGYTAYDCGKKLISYLHLEYVF